MKLYIKNMVSLRCKILLKEELIKLGYHIISIDLGEAEVLGNISLEDMEHLKFTLLTCGLEITNNKKIILIEKIKNIIIEMIQQINEMPIINYSNFISQKLNYDYTYLSNIFSEENGITIQQFIIINKIEKVKELLMYNEMSLTEIAWQLHYSSVAHLSNQFKKVTGTSPSYFKLYKTLKRIKIEEVGNTRLAS